MVSDAAPAADPRPTARESGGPIANNLSPNSAAPSMLRRQALAVAVRRRKEDVRRDLGGDLSRAQETILEAAAQA
jgi:hypothetical protein